MSLVSSCPGSTLAAGLLCLGCASYSARPLDPAAELARLSAIDPGSLRIEYAPAESAAGSAPAKFDLADGLDEAELVALALTIHPGLRARRAELGEAEALLVTAGLFPNPDLDAFVRPGVAGSAGTSFGLDLLFELLRPDERPARRALAEAEIERVRAEILAEELGLCTELRRARIAALTAEQAARLLRQELALRDEAVALVREQRALGEATELSLALAELDRTSFEREVREAQASVERERQGLRRLLGLPPSLEIALVGSGNELVFTLSGDLDDAELDARLIAQAPELRARAAGYRLAEEALRLAVALQYPSLALGPSYEKDTDGSAGLGLGASIELPLFDRNQGEISARLALREHRRAEYVAALHELRARAFAARAEVRRARAEVEWLQRELAPLVQRTEAIFEDALRARELSIFDWLAVRSRAVRARRDLLDALSRYARAVVELDSATGTPLVVVLTEAPGEHAQR